MQASGHLFHSSKQLKVGDQVVNKKYTILHCIHDGPHSKIYTVSFMKNNKQVIRVFKTQPIQNQNNTHHNVGMHYGANFKKNVQSGIKNQVNIIKNLFTNENGKIDIKVGFPHFYQYGTENNSNYLVMGIYGPNLLQLMKLCGGKFSARTTLMIGLQILDRLQEIHENKYLYCNLRPQNFTVGLGKQSYLIYILDFSSAIMYKSKSKSASAHIPYQQVGTSPNGNTSNGNSNNDHTFTSVNTQLGIQYSRRDDIQSLMYLILYLFKGKLPWMDNDGIGFNSNNISGILDLKMQDSQNNNLVRDMNHGESTNSLKGNSLNFINISSSNRIQEQNSKILEIKRRISPQSMFKCLSFELIDMMCYIKTLSFYQKPDYMYLRKKLWNALMDTDYQQLRNNMIIYDWNLRQPLDFEIYRDIPKFKRVQQHDEILQADQESPRTNRSKDSHSSSEQTKNNVNNKNKHIYSHFHQQKINAEKLQLSYELQKSVQKKRSQKIEKKKHEFSQDEQANIIDEQDMSQSQDRGNKGVMENNYVDEKLKKLKELGLYSPEKVKGNRYSK